MPSTPSSTRAPPSADAGDLTAGRQDGIIRHVLVCLDRSPLAEACLPQARLVVDAFEAKITLLHVMASPEGDQPSIRPDALDWEITRREAERYLARIQGELEEQGLSPQQVTTEVTQGRPAERIVTVANKIGADLTVLGRHGERGASAWNLGSTVQQVLALVPGSVLLVPSGSESLRNVPAKRVMVAVDGSLRTQSVLPGVARLAAFLGAVVVLVHVVPEPIQTALLFDEEDLRLAKALAARLEAKAEAYLAQLEQRFFAEASGVQTLILRQSNKRRALLDAARRLEVDLLVLAAHGATCDAERPFGSVTAYAMSHGKLPLLVLQDLPRSERESSRPPPNGEAVHASRRAAFGARPMEGP